MASLKPVDYQNIRYLMDKCDHAPDQSPQDLFVRDIKLLLDLDAEHRPLKSLENYLPSRICGDRLNRILLTYSIEELYNLSIPSIAISHGIFCKRLWGDILFHPKMHRILSITCPLSKRMHREGEAIIAPIVNVANVFPLEDYVFNHNFGAFCSLACEALTSIGWSHDYLKKVQDRDHLVVVSIIRSLWLSMKYWKKYHVLYFLNHYLWMFNEPYRIAMGFYGTHNIKVNRSHQFYRYWYLCIDTVCRKAKKFRLRGQCDYRTWTVVQEILYTDEDGLLYTVPRNKQIGLLKELRRYEINALRGKLSCGWDECQKRGTDLEQPMKVCKQCKMTYYCSRKCQKKAWNSTHRKLCTELKELYPYL